MKRVNAKVYKISHEFIKFNTMKLTILFKLDLKKNDARRL